MFKFLLSSSLVVVVVVVVVGAAAAAATVVLVIVVIGGGIGIVVMHVPANENPVLVWSELKEDIQRKKT